MPIRLLLFLIFKNLQVRRTDTKFRLLWIIRLQHRLTAVRLSGEQILLPTLQQKYMDGHAACVGGAIIDSGNFDWNAHADKFPGLTTPDKTYHGIVYTEKFGKGAYITKATAQLMRDLGSIQAPQNAFLLNIGLETLHLRVPRHCENALKVAKYLKGHDKVAWVSYPSLEGDKYYDLAQKYMPNGSCGVIAFGLNGTREEAIEFYGQAEIHLHRNPCGRRTDLRTASRQPYSPPAHRRTVARSGSSSGLDSSFSGHRECKRHHSRH